MPSATDYAAEGAQVMSEGAILQPVGAEKQPATPQEEIKQAPSGKVQEVDDL
jgi:hypothetical protein